MATLLNTTPAATYPALIKFSDNSAIGAAAKYLSDGAGNNLPIAVSTTSVGINTTSPTTKLQINEAINSNFLKLARVDDPTQYFSAYLSSAPNLWDIGPVADDGNTLLRLYRNNYIVARVGGVETMRLVSNKLGVNLAGATPSAVLQIKGTGTTSATTAFIVDKSDGNTSFTIKDDSQGTFYGGVAMNFYNAAQYLNVKGSGTTSATFSTKVTNSAGTSLFLIQDDGKVIVQNNTLTVSGYGARINNLTVGTLGSKTLASTDNDGALTVSTGVVVTGGGAVGTPIASAVFQADSTTKGVLLPRMTQAQIVAIATPANGLMCYNTDINHVCFYDSVNGWRKISHSAM